MVLENAHLNVWNFYIHVYINDKLVVKLFYALWNIKEIKEFIYKKWFTHKLKIIRDKKGV